ncbi:MULTISPECIES: STAS domain-containing protein [Leptospira]|uniref:STAS domain protein n=14 Tax=Leptospira TaxID=171 RepID=M3GD80_LEPBO|nr:MULTISPECIES: STAS domain-containing protein [Leptospira]EMF83978.1 STAS domain protein [Leptospira weilii serovar Topaz str. LT2116]EMF98886.1 STAS domain protein [Leptospira borgpetersenii str. 200701203]EMM70577.1 STAS domain protein [Leptospira weilii str. 2006001855]EMO08316.1 STAS domain protein [Leptospira borgpetersenii str. Noumea 25]EMO64452.1 STAS domain protein [Leptospira borgpetersenii serovar Pomona str. 200901868]EMY13330.1 STAS domain protein [Leptospira weilii str. Ecocha
MESFNTEILTEGTTCTIRIQGSISLKNAFALKELIIKKHGEGFIDIVLDFSGDAYLDSSGIGAIFNSQKYVTERNGSLKLKNISRDVMTILKIANLDKHLDIIH